MAEERVIQEKPAFVIGETHRPSFSNQPLASFIAAVDATLGLAVPSSSFFS